MQQKRALLRAAIAPLTALLLLLDSAYCWQKLVQSPSRYIMRRLRIMPTSLRDPGVAVCSLVFAASIGRTVAHLQGISATSARIHRPGSTRLCITCSDAELHRAGRQHDIVGNQGAYQRLVKRRCRAVLCEHWSPSVQNGWCKWPLTLLCRLRPRRRWSWRHLPEWPGSPLLRAAQKATAPAHPCAGPACQLLVFKRAMMPLPAAPACTCVTHPMHAVLMAQGVRSA